MNLIGFFRQQATARLEKSNRIAKCQIAGLSQWVLGAGCLLSVSAPALAQAPWPFDQPALSTLRSSPRKVFAHYFPPYPLSIDNKDWKEDYYTVNYLSPFNEIGNLAPQGQPPVYGPKHKAYGGLMRQRPMPRPVRSEPSAPVTSPTVSWQEMDMRDEVRSAAKLGLDGFTFNIMCYEPVLKTDKSNFSRWKLWSSVKWMLDAAKAVDSGFKVVLMPDMNADDFKTVGTENPAADEARLTDAITELSNSTTYPSVYRIGGKLVLAPYLTENRNAAWWTTWLAKMKNEKGVDIYFVPVFADWQSNASSFNPIISGISDWGNRTPESNSAWNTMAAQMHEAMQPGQANPTKVCMLPVAPQDSRPKSLKYAEAKGSANYRKMWENAINLSANPTNAQKADWVQIVTWNDYSEATEISPSTGTQSSFYDLTAYYVTWFKTGQKPPITRDVIYYFHRAQSVNATYNTTLQPAPFTTSDNTTGQSPGVDRIEMLAFLTQPATLEIQFGGQSYPPLLRVCRNQLVFRFVYAGPNGKTSFLS